MKWTKVTIETTTEATDMLSYYLNEYGVEGIEIQDKVPLSEEDKKAMFIDILPVLEADDGVAEISCYIDDDKISVKELCQYIQNQLLDMSSYMNVGSKKISLSEADDRDWIDKWKEFFHPFRLEGNIVIQPTWTEELPPNEDDIVIYIDPGVAFGTGSHETTKLCIAGLKKYIKSNKTTDVLDVGCGSGILSIVAKKLGANRIYGIDYDKLAVASSLENLELNHIPKDSYTIVYGDVIGDKTFAETVSLIGQYDIVVANILADVIIPLSSVIRPFMKKDGIFISSGIIDIKENAVRNALVSNGFEILEVLHMGEWVSFVAK